MAERDPPTLGITIYPVCIHTQRERALKRRRKNKEDASYIYVYYKYQTGRKEKELLHPY